MNFQPYPTRSGLIALALVVLSGVLGILLLNQLLQQRDLFTIFQLLVALLLALLILGVTVYWSLIVFRLHYSLSRNGLIIQWGLSQQLIPIDRIEDIVPGRSVPDTPRFRGLNLGGLRMGWGEVEKYGPLKFHTTAALTDSLLVVTPSHTFVISPRQPDMFFEAWQRRRPLGPTQHWSLGARRRWPPANSVLADPWTGWLLGAAALACLGLFGYLAIIWPDLPPVVPVHFNAFMQADRIADKSALLMLPAAGAIVLVLNTLVGSLSYRWEKVSAYLLWTGTVIMQVCLWIAIFMVIT